MADEPRIAVGECKRRHVYRIHSRNLSFGVFAPEKENGFIGIREKFGRLYLFTEHHHDNGPPFGTVSPVEDLGPLEDPNLRLVAGFPTVCGYCGERLEYVEVDGGVKKGDTTYRGEWQHLTGDGSCNEPRPEGHMNRLLYQALEKIEQSHGTGPSVWQREKEARDDEAE